jgi:hypothetical protein
VGVVLAFAVGYLVGANTGKESYDEVVDALKAVRDSDEFRGLVGAVRGHLGASLRQLAGIIEDQPGPEDSPSTRLLERVRTIMARPPISPAS